MLDVRKKILIIDDEPHIIGFLRVTLESEGYEVFSAHTAQDGIKAIKQYHPHLLVLDLGLPEQDGQIFLKNIRSWLTIPILILTVRANEEQKVLALDNGANDYVTKPFGIQEFIARVRALLRQYSLSLTEEIITSYSSGDLHIDFVHRTVQKNNVLIHLSRKEFSVLSKLAQSPDQVITQQSLLKEIWGPTHQEDTHYLRIIIGHLRQKIGDDRTKSNYIQTEQGVGYRLVTLK